MGHPGDKPDVAVPGADRGPVAVRQKIKPTQPQPAQPRVAGWQHEIVDGKGTVARPSLDSVMSGAFQCGGPPWVRFSRFSPAWGRRRAVSSGGTVADLATRAIQSVNFNGSPPAGMCSRRLPAVSVSHCIPCVAGRMPAAKVCGLEERLSLTNGADGSNTAGAGRGEYGQDMAWLVGDLQDQLLAARPKVKRPCEDRPGSLGHQAGTLQYGGLPYRVGENDLVAIMVQAPVVDPAARQRTVILAIATADAHLRKRTVGRVGPAGSVGIGKTNVADNAGMNLVPAIEVDAVPVDESLPAPAGRDAQGIVVIHDPVASLGDAARDRYQGARRCPCTRSSNHRGRLRRSP